MRWRVYLIETMTGQVGPELDVSTASVDVELNGIEQIQVTASRESLAGVERRWWSPWAGGVVVTFEDEWTAEIPVAAGPIVQPVSEDLRAGTVTVGARGVAALLEHRVVLASDFRPGDEDELRRSRLDWSGVSLGSMIGRIITRALAKRNGALPIVVPGEVKADRAWTFEGWNLANIGAWKAVRDISDLDDGPDVMLRPRWATSERTRIEWVLATGVEGQPGIPQIGEVLWDATAVDSPVAGMSISSDASLLANRVYCTGAGEGAGTVVAIAEQQVIPERMPLMETVVTDSDSGDPTVLAGQARSALVADAVDQLSVQISPGEVCPVGSWQVGDMVRLVTRGHLQVPDGEHRLRVIAAKWSSGDGLVDVELQPDRLGTEMSW